MTRGVPHSPELRAQVIAAVLAGTSVAQAAAQFGLDKGLVSRWVAANPLQPVATDQRTRAEELGDHILTLIDQHVVTISAQLSFATRTEWLEKQSAAELAQLVAVERDTALRLLAGLEHIDGPGQLPAGSADAAPGAADDDR